MSNVLVKTPEELSAVLRQTRTALGVHSLDLAATVNISHVTLRRLESGLMTEAVRSLLKIMDELGILMTLSPPPGVSSIKMPQDGSPAPRTRIPAKQPPARQSRYVWSKDSLTPPPLPRFKRSR